MGISRSAEPGEGWTAGASVFSGRPDPTWPVPAEVGTRLGRLWEELPRWSGERPAPAPLGYRGCHLSAPDGRVWRVFRELVSLAREDRRDQAREFERTLLASAPPGTLPPIEA